METKHQEHQYCGECIFCSSKCPECGSTDIEADFKLSCSYQNDTEDQISIFQHIEEIEFRCEHCGEWIKEDEFENFVQLDDLYRGIRKDFAADKTRFTHRDDGKIDVERYEINGHVIDREGNRIERG